ncbi:hypothetical protein HMPREF1109_0441 [Streptococcus intermedius SK54 = ATCC 27335]|jgi:hypothetical protein|nr:hypothetical protein HMPREF1109_0441 [Streptococcus intermedius SK54 = ATCC 27335]
MEKEIKNNFKLIYLNIYFPVKFTWQDFFHYFVQCKKFLLDFMQENSKMRVER